MAFKMHCPKCFGLDYSIERDNRTFGAVAQAFELVFHCRCGKQLFGDALLKEYDAQKKEFDANGEGGLPRPTSRRAEDELGAARRALTPDGPGHRGDSEDSEEDDPRDDDDDRPPQDKRWQQRMAALTADDGEDDDEDDDETPIPAPTRARAKRSAAPSKAAAAAAVADEEESEDAPVAISAPTPTPAPPKAAAAAPAPAVDDDDEEEEEDDDDEDDGNSTICAWPGCTSPRRPNSKYCSRACSNKNARSRHKTRAKKPRGKKGAGDHAPA